MGLQPSPRVISTSLCNKFYYYLAKLTYVEAVCSEISRLGSVVPLGIGRGTTKEVQINGYTVPEGTYIMPNLWFIHRDPAQWGDDANEFRPERFLDEEGRVLNPPSFMPFSIGKNILIIVSNKTKQKNKDHTDDRSIMRSLKPRPELKQINFGFIRILWISVRSSRIAVTITLLIGYSSCISFPNKNNPQTCNSPARICR